MDNNKDQAKQLAFWKHLAITILACVVTAALSVGITLAVVGKNGTTASGNQKQPVAFGVEENYKSKLDPAKLAESATIYVEKTDKGVNVVDKPSKAKVVDFYYDYNCHYCYNFEATNESDLDTMVNSGEMTMAYHPLSIFGDPQTSDYGLQHGTHGVIAAAIVAKDEPQKFIKFNKTMWKAYPESTDSVWTEEAYRGVFKEAGLSQKTIDKAIDAMKDQRFVDAVSQITIKSAKGLKENNGIDFRGTPTILLDGKDLPADLNFQEAGQFRKYVETGQYDPVQPQAGEQAQQ